MTSGHIRFILAGTVAITLLAATLPAQVPAFHGASKAKKERAPQFTDFPVMDEFLGKSARVDLSSHPNARFFRTRLRAGAQEGPNFAGHYAIVNWGCGNECGELLVIDLRTGKVFGALKTPPKAVSGSTVHPKTEILQYSRWVDFNPSSKLLIVDLPCPEDYNPCVSTARSGEPVRYYLLEDNGLRLIHKIPCRLVNDRQQCGNECWIK